MSTRRAVLKVATLLGVGLGTTSYPFLANANPAKPVARKPAAKASATVNRHRVDVVKVVSFACPISRASESFDGPIKEAVRQYGGKFVFGPFPSEGDASQTEAQGARERVYYASRSFGVAVEERVRASLFKGVQDMNLGLGDYMQTYSWLSNDASELKSKFGDLFKRAQEKEAGASLEKTAYLAHAAGANALPSYVILVDGEPRTALGPDDVVGGSLPKLRDLVVATIHKLSESH